MQIGASFCKTCKRAAHATCQRRQRALEERFGWQTAVQKTPDGPLMQVVCTPICPECLGQRWQKKPFIEVEGGRVSCPVTVVHERKKGRPALGLNQCAGLEQVFSTVELHIRHRKSRDSKKHLVLRALDLNLIGGHVYEWKQLARTLHLMKDYERHATRLEVLDKSDPPMVLLLRPVVVFQGKVRILLVVTEEARLGGRLIDRTLRAHSAVQMEVPDELLDFVQGVHHSALSSSWPEAPLQVDLGAASPPALDVDWQDDDTDELLDFVQAAAPLQFDLGACCPPALDVDWQDDDTDELLDFVQAVLHSALSTSWPAAPLQVDLGACCPPALDVDWQDGDTDERLDFVQAVQHSALSNSWPAAPLQVDLGACCPPALDVDWQDDTDELLDFVQAVQHSALSRSWPAAPLQVDLGACCPPALDADWQDDDTDELLDFVQAAQRSALSTSWPAAPLQVDLGACCPPALDVDWQDGDTDERLDFVQAVQHSALSNSWPAAPLQVDLGACCPPALDVDWQDDDTNELLDFVQAVQHSVLSNSWPAAPLQVDLAACCPPALDVGWQDDDTDELLDFVQAVQHSVLSNSWPAAPLQVDLGACYPPALDVDWQDDDTDELLDLAQAVQHSALSNSWPAAPLQVDLGACCPPALDVDWQDDDTDELLDFVQAVQYSALSSSWPAGPLQVDLGACCPPALDVGWRNDDESKLLVSVQEMHHSALSNSWPAAPLQVDLGACCPPALDVGWQDDDTDERPDFVQAVQRSALSNSWPAAPLQVDLGACCPPALDVDWQDNDTDELLDFVQAVQHSALSNSWPAAPLQVDLGACCPPALDVGGQDDDTDERLDFVQAVLHSVLSTSWPAAPLQVDLGACCPPALDVDWQDDDTDERLDFVQAVQRSASSNSWPAAPLQVDLGACYPPALDVDWQDDDTDELLDFVQAVQHSALSTSWPAAPLQVDLGACCPPALDVDWKAGDADALLDLVQEMQRVALWNIWPAAPLQAELGAWLSPGLDFNWRKDSDLGQCSIDLTQAWCTVTLTWGHGGRFKSDMDLHSWIGGQHLYYARRTLGCCQLDFDANAFETDLQEHPAERLALNEAGTFPIRVDNYKNRDQSDVPFEVVVENPDKVIIRGLPKGQGRLCTIEAKEGKRRKVKDQKNSKAMRGQNKKKEKRRPCFEGDDEVQPGEEEESEDKDENTKEEFEKREESGEETWSSSWWSLVNGAASSVRAGVKFVKDKVLTARKSQRITRVAAEEVEAAPPQASLTGGTSCGRRILTIQDSGFVDQAEEDWLSAVSRSVWEEAVTEISLRPDANAAYEKKWIEGGIAEIHAEGQFEVLEILRPAKVTIPGEWLKTRLPGRYLPVCEVQLDQKVVSQGFGRTGLQAGGFGRFGGRAVPRYEDPQVRWKLNELKPCPRKEVQVQEVEEPGECEPRARCAVKLEWGIEWGQPYYRSDLDLHARKLDRDGEASYSPQSSHLFFGQMCLGRCELLKDINRTETKVVRWPKEMMTLDEAGRFGIFVHNYEPRDGEVDIPYQVTVSGSPEVIFRGLWPEDTDMTERMYLFTVELQASKCLSCPHCRVRLRPKSTHTDAFLSTDEDGAREPKALKLVKESTNVYLKLKQPREGGPGGPFHYKVVVSNALRITVSSRLRAKPKHYFSTVCEVKTASRCCRCCLW
ncbi:unnamed protein product [Effrenium voratum]|uniref:Uncharacterized protein n=1 Tax=Effrenium voratum TaxID=2562239 RepID=A0AA36HPE2_9DINO|nr:unnamed protein product [Effrenium voratum]